MPGYTFSYSPETDYEVLVVVKPRLAVYARDDKYTVGSGTEAFDMRTGYVELGFEFIGF